MVLLIFQTSLNYSFVTENSVTACIIEKKNIYIYISLKQSLNLASNSFELIVKMVLCEANLIKKERERKRMR